LGSEGGSRCWEPIGVPHRSTDRISPLQGGGRGGGVRREEEGAETCEQMDGGKEDILGVRLVEPGLVGELGDRCPGGREREMDLTRAQVADNFFRSVA
jgi:hypothetical protein